MLNKRFTILIFSQGASSVKSISIPKLLPAFCLVSILAAFFGLGMMVTYSRLNNAELRAQVTALELMRDKTVKQNVELHFFAEKIRLMNQEMDKLTQNDKKLWALTSSSQELTRPTPLALGGSESQSATLSGLKVNQETLIRQMHANLDNLLEQSCSLEQSQHQLDKIMEDRRSLLASWPTLWPAKGSITSGFGYRIHPISHTREFHRGIDIGGPRGTPIISPADGVVVSASWKPGYGLMVVINHGYGIVTRYGHCNKAYVKPGQRVERGQKIAAIGSTGRTTGAHLHYEVIIGGVPSNPKRYMTQR